MPPNDTYIHHYIIFKIKSMQTISSIYGAEYQNLYNLSAWRPMAPFVWIFAELNRGDTNEIHIIWKSPQNTSALADFVLPDNTEKRIKTVCKTIEKTQFLCVFFCRNIIRNTLLFCAVRVIYGKRQIKQCIEK